MLFRKLKILKKFTFWFIILSIYIIILNISGNDDKNIMLIGLNPIISKLIYTEPFRSFVLKNDDITINLYIFHLLTFILYGLILDFIIFYIKKVINYVKSYI